MDYGKAFTFAFDDEDWVVKLILGGVFMLLSVVVVGIFFVLGYLLEIVRNVVEGKERPLPSWDNLGEKFVQGLILFVILLLLSIPLMLFSCVTSAFSSLAAGTRSDAAQILIALVNLGLGLLSFLYGLVYAVFIPAFTIRYAMTRDFGATFNIGEAWAVIRADLGSYVLILIVAWVASLVASLGVIACVIGVFVTSFWAMLVQGHLYGQYYRTYVAPSAAVTPT